MVSPDRDSAYANAPFRVFSTQDGVFASEPLGAEFERTPRIWTALLAGLLGVFFAVIASDTVTRVAVSVQRTADQLNTEDKFWEWLGEFAQTRIGLVVLVIPGQLALLSMAVCAAFLSPWPATARLALQRGRLPYWVWGLFVVGTPVVGVASSLALDLIAKPSMQMQLMDRMIQTHTQGFLPGLLVVVVLLPGIVEELLFRGYIQSRLVQRAHPAMAIGVAAIMFAIAHFDAVYAVGVLPLGLWLGLVAWRAECIWPAILCHITNNIAAVVMAMYQGAAFVGFKWDPITRNTLLLSGPAFLLSLVVLFRRRPEPGGLT